MGALRAGACDARSLSTIAPAGVEACRGTTNANPWYTRGNETNGDPMRATAMPYVLPDHAAAKLTPRCAAAWQRALEIAEHAGIGVDLTGDGPVFYEVEVAFIGHDAGLGALAGTVGRAIEAEFDRHKVRLPGLVKTTIVATVMSGTYDQGLAFLVGLVNAESGVED